MVKLISTESLMMFMGPKFFRHEHMTKIEFQKYSKMFLSKETIYQN